MMTDQGEDASFAPLVLQLAELLSAREWCSSTAESCTGGWIAKLFTDMPGSSAWFDCAFVAYSNRAKQEMLGVGADTLLRHGAVSEAVVKEMAAGALLRSQAQVAVAVSGIAGPGGGSLEKPVGTVWIAWGLTEQAVLARCFRFEGDRDAVRRQSVRAALEGLIESLGADV